MQSEPDLLAGGLDLSIVEVAGCAAEPGGRRFRDCSQTPEVGGGDGHRPPPAPPSRGYAPAAASSAVETSGTFPSHTVLWAPLESRPPGTSIPPPISTTSNLWMAEDGTLFNRHNVRRSIRPGGPLYLRLLPCPRWPLGRRFLIPVRPPSHSVGWVPEPGFPAALG